jgi:hypothetical protein
LARSILQPLFGQHRGRGHLIWSNQISEAANRLSSSGTSSWPPPLLCVDEKSGSAIRVD